MARRRGFLLTIEGVDGSGKSTQIRRIVSHLGRAGHRVTVVREPGGTRLAERIRRLLLDSRSAGLALPAELFLYLAARGQLTEEVIGPALSRGQVVVCDRFTDSTLAYQGGGRGFEESTLRKLNDLSTQQRHPDLTLILDLPPAVSSRRVAGKPDRLESEKEVFYKRVRARYRRIARTEPRRVTLISATGTRDEVFGRIRQVLDARLKPVS
jgi:dTMP kinase